MPLADEVIVYPGHGAGSACGKNMSKDTVDTLGHQKAFNYALRANMTRDEFIEEVTAGLVEPPQYFPNVIMNLKGGNASIDEIIKRGTTPLSADAFQHAWETHHALVIDARSKDVFPQGYITGSIFIGLDDNFAPWVGALVTDLNQPILLITDEGKEEEAVIRLSRVGYDHAIGYLKGGIRAWKAAGYSTDILDEISADVFAQQYKLNNNITLLDVRKRVNTGASILKVLKISPSILSIKNIHQLDKNNQYFIHCAGGYRSVIAASILKSRGYNHIVNIQGGFKALSNTSLAKTTYLNPKPCYNYKRLFVGSSRE
jgi:rhodanese-related sulfurtransferase